MKKVLVLGAGLVARPLVRYLLDHGFHVTVADLVPQKVEKMLEGHRNGRAVALNADDTAAMHTLIADCDCAVSLLPATRHPDVARSCLAQNKHMITASYISPAMRGFDAEAKAKGLLFLNEIGVDPGIDHMSAMKVIHAEQKAGATLVGFSSMCGGLPAPEANDNPFGYKFSWSPKGVLIASRNNAKFLRDGTLVEIPNERLFSNPLMFDIPGVGRFEGYPNRDSVSYIETYGFDAHVKDMFRGTLRNPGHCKLYTQIIKLGIFDDSNPQSFAGQTYLGLMEKMFGAPVKKTIPERLGVAAADSPLEALEYIGLFDKRPVEIERGSLMDLVADRMAKALAYKPGERDMLLMRHDITFTKNGGKTKECVTAIMADYGLPDGDSSMARTVSLPAAIGVRMLLEGTLKVRGVHAPVSPEFYNPILAELETMNITFTETRTTI